MSQYVPLGRSPESPEDRRALIEEHIAAEEYLVRLQLSHLQRKVIEFLLTRKGYRPEDIETDKEFRVELPDVTFTVKADIVVILHGKSFLIITCAMSSLESWERHAAAFCRVVVAYQIPYAAVTDGSDARVIDAVQGAVISEGIDSIPTRAEAEELIANVVFGPCPEGRCEREKRILHAFDGIRCPLDYPKE